jgi:hypothetical protein
MADKDITPTPTSTPEPRDFTSMSADELFSLIETEGKRFVEQTKDRDIEIDDYLATEKFNLARVMNLFFAFEYFIRGAGSESKKVPSDYSMLYQLVYEKIDEHMGGIGLYGPEYIVSL